MRPGSLYIAAVIGLAALFCAGHAFAGFGQPSPWQTGLQHANTPVMDAIIGFNDVLLYVMTVIAGFVFVLLVTAMVRFNSYVHPAPSKRTGNWPLEVAWTLIPFCIVAFIVFLSFRLLFFEEDIPRAELTVKATGHQWFWGYSYPDHGNFKFYSEMLNDESRKPGQPRLLAVNNDLVVPVNKVVRVQVIGGDVIHSFSVPSFGIKIDAIPGRLNETWFQATREGMYYGQCSELCGMNHSYMPIAIRVVSEQVFDAWVEEAKKKYGQGPVSGPTENAALESIGADE
ncbi:MAG: cytochrome c oxidase subunit II [Hyphomicrobium sp.]